MRPNIGGCYFGTPDSAEFTGLSSTEFDASVNHNTLRFARFLMNYFRVFSPDRLTKPTGTWCKEEYLIDESRAMAYGRLPGESVLAITSVEMNRPA